MKNAQELVHLQAHVPVDGAAIGKVQLALGAGGEGVHHQCAFIGPPAIHRGFSHACVSGNGFDGEVGETGLLQQLQRTAQSGLTRMFAARPARTAFAASLLTRLLLFRRCHFLGNQARSIESNTYRIVS